MSQSKIEIVLVDESGGESPPATSADSAIPASPASATPTPATPATPASPPPSAASPGSPSPGASSPPASQGAGSGATGLLESISQAINATVSQSRTLQGLVRGVQQNVTRLIRLPQQIASSLANLIPNSFRQALSGIFGTLGNAGKKVGSSIWDKIAAKQRSQIIALLSAILQRQGGSLPRPMRPTPLRPGGPAPSIPNSRPLSGPQLPTVPPRPRGGGASQAARGAAGTGAAARGAAGGAGGGAVARAAGGAIARLASNPYTLAVAVIIAAFAALALATYGLVKAFRSQERELAEVSGEVSQALAGREVARIENKLERSERIGTEIASFAGTWTNFETALYKLTTEILDLLTILMPLVEFVVQMITDMLKDLRQIVAILNLLFEIMDEFAAGGNLTQETIFQAGMKVVDAFLADRPAQNQRPNKLFSPNPFQDTAVDVRQALNNQNAPARPGGGP